jgi:hypothetical protein
MRNCCLSNFTGVNPRYNKLTTSLPI